MKILMTGFEPFGGQSINASWEAVAAMEPVPGVDIVRVQLPVVYDAVSELLPSLVKQHEPQALLMVGQANGVPTLLIERVALNLCDTTAGDNAGVVRCDISSVQGAPDAYFATLPVRAMMTRMMDAGIPASLSLCAGTYLCNHAMYTGIHLSKQHPGFLAGFIHVPLLPCQAVATRQASMPLTMIAEGLRQAVIAIDEAVNAASFN